VDQHHTVEDVGITSAEAVPKALGSKRGICAPDISDADGRKLWPLPPSILVGALLCCKRENLQRKRVGDFQVDLSKISFQGFAQAARPNVHLRRSTGVPRIIQVEAMFKAFARALRFAVRATSVSASPAQHKGSAMKITHRRLRRRQRIPSWSAALHASAPIAAPQLHPNASRTPKRFCFLASATSPP